MRLKRRDTILGAAAMVLAPRAALAQTTPIGGSAFGSTWRLVSDLRDPMGAARIITARIAAIDAAVSPYRASSALSRFNRADVGASVEVPAAMADVVAAALQATRDTQGAFDPTTGPLVAHFGFGPIVGQPGRAEDIDLRGTVLRKATLGLTLDLCGIAKGYALDCLTKDLIARGATDFLLELGGEIRAVGNHPSGRAWQVAIEDPFSPGFAARHIVAPGALALATSGHRSNGLMGPVEISHVIDPGSARPATGFAASVSVLAQTGMEADAMATALLAMGAVGPDFARRNHISALFIPATPNPQASITTGDFSTHLVV